MKCYETNVYERKGNSAAGAYHVPPHGAVYAGEFTSDAEIIDLGIRYSRIVFGFAVIISLDLSFEKLFQAVGRMTVSMVSMLCRCIANIILDPILIFGLGPVPAMGIEGAAIATGLGQVLTLVIYLLYYFLRPIPVKIRRECWKPDREIVRRIYSVGISAALTLSLPSLMISCLNVILAGFSQSYVLVLGVYYKLQTFLYLILGIMALGTILCLAVPQPLMGLFTNTTDTAAAGAAALRIICLGFVVSSVSVTTCGALEGLGLGKPSLLISLCRYILIMIPAAFLLSRAMGAAGVWYGFPVSEALTAIVSGILFSRAVSFQSKN